MDLFMIVLLIVLTTIIAVLFIYCITQRKRLKAKFVKFMVAKERAALDEKDKRFPLGHTALYAKGWYRTSQYFWDDLRKLIGADGYLENLNKNDIYHIIINRFSEMKIRESELLQVLDGINPKNGWECGYPTKGNFPYQPEAGKSELPEWNFQEAVVRYCMSRIAFLNMDKIKRVVPNFKEVLPIRLHDNETMKQGIDRVKKSFADVINK